MTKEDFLKRLEESLSKLDEKDRKKVLGKYKAIFTRKSKKGLTDEQIILEFGNYNDLVKKILSQYNINTPFEESANIISEFFLEFLKTIEDIVKMISKKDPKEVSKMIVQVLICLICIALLKLPFLFIRDLITGVLDFLFRPLSTILIFCFRFILEISYVIIAITLFVKVYNIIIKPAFKSKPLKKKK